MRIVFTAALGLAFLRAETPTTKDVHTIYVPLMHSYSGVDNLDFDALIQSKLISSLAEHCGTTCTVLEENPDEGADAVLTGSIFRQASDQYHVRVQGAMRLVHRDGHVLWAATLYSNPFAKSASSSLADKTAKKLVSFLSGKPDKDQ